MINNSSIKLSKLLLTQLFILAVTINSLSQDIFQTELQDSVSINIKDLLTEEKVNKGYQMRLFDSILFVFLYENKVFYQFNLSTRKIEKYSLEQTSKKQYISQDIYISKDFITTIDFSGSEIRQYDWRGELRKQIKPRKLFSKYNVTPFTKVIYDNSLDRFYLSIATKFREEFIITKPEKAKKFYNRSGLIGVFDSKGKLVDELGRYDSIYQTGFYTHSDRYHFSLTNENNLILSQQLSHKIHLINPQSGEEEKELDLKGKYIDIQDIPISKSINKEETKHNIISSFNYGNISNANKGGLTFRYYKISATDTTTSTINIKDIAEKGLAVCKAPTQRELDQEKILKSKKLYIQLFDLNSETVFYDGIFPFKGDYIFSNKYIKKDEIWTGKLTLEEIKLFRYRIVK